MEINFWIAILAGLASFLSPCVLSLVPVYLTYLSGRSISVDSSQPHHAQRVLLFLHGVSFVVGFSVVFIFLGLAASAIGNLFYDGKDWIARIGGVIVILFGLHLSGVLTIPFLNYDLRAQSVSHKKRGFVTSFFMGVFFSAGWSPCVGPVLGVILILAANSGSLVTGLWMLIAYSIGMGIPFLVSTILVDFLTRFIRRFKHAAVFFEKIFGLILVLIGILLFLGIFERLARFSSFLNFGL
jgi:cytochrome c-type biogenesis protein